MTWTTRPRSDFGTLAAIVAGQGPQLLLIHGVGLRAESWGSQIDAFAQTHRVVAVDLPGHGHSAALPAKAGLSEFSAALAACLDRPSIVIGHSFGAMIALDLAVHHPHHVAGVAALNAVFRRSPAARDAVVARANSLDGVQSADPGGPLERWFGSDASPERAACEAWLRGVDPAGYKAAYSVFAKQDGPQDAQCGGLHCPALYMTGANEPNSTPEMSRRMAELTPKGRAVVIAGAAHMMPMTHAPEVNKTLMQFAQECF